MPEKRDAAILRVRIQPGARRSEVVGWVDGVLRVRIAAPPIEGRANEALVAFVADLLDLPKGRVLIKSGHGSRDKVLLIDGVASDVVAAKLRQIE